MEETERGGDPSVRYEPTVVKRFVLWMSGLRAFPSASRAVVRLDRLLTCGGHYERSLVRAGGLVSIVMFVPGRRSGIVRPVSLLAIPLGEGAVAVVGSNWGKPEHPLWTLNLAAVDVIEAVVDGTRRRMRVRPVRGAERAALWPRLVREWPNYAVYQRRAGRTLRVYRLDPTV